VLALNFVLNLFMLISSFFLLKEIGSTFKQIQFSYAANRRCKLPLRLYVTSYGGKTAEIGTLKYPNHLSWQITFESKPYNEVFETDKIVYLTAESSNVLEQLDPSMVYVIGGLVDHNSKKVFLFFLFYFLSFLFSFSHFSIRLSFA
jgi:tRNA (guanine9-N1)-methyltransferase